ncbi:glycerophosphodiester phosphodiesterase family protein [Desulfurococcus amylolyticus]|uniref:Glycerophosphoryl diester phosphodiesterase n=1 Tax=Desulfurococcus amylolyticus DSM 16532 TaxID=768672 RepID=I3XS77_DESAM|nr:glycerophosphodiester phosphodiesterase family protein [Desulfurococcus amylolyticus]AFL66801.1 glycerophosphoryl diester phosphodiesterase [Desulfurococcus amylolyticus DSM 16532]
MALNHVIIGHRGFPVKYPENTIAGFLGAILHGAHGVELDVWLTRDEVPVVIHDRSTRRVAGVELDVKNATIEEIRRLYLGMGQGIPTLEDVYRAVPEGYRLYVEVKDIDAVHKVYEATVKHKRASDVVFLSFIRDVLVEFRKLDPGLRLALNVESLEKAREALKLHRNIKLYSVNLPVVAPLVIGFNVFKEYVREARELGLRVVVWDTEEYKYDYSLYGEIASLIDEAIVNDPVRIRNYLEIKP